MKFRELEYGRTFNLGQYESERISLTVDLDSIEDLDEAFRTVKAKVFKLREEGKLLEETRAEIEAGPKFDVPNIDLHTVEHDGWRSWRKDDKGACSFPAKEGESGWIRTKDCSNDIAILYKAMKKQGIDKISLGLFEYKISGEDFLQRKRLKKVSETTETVKEQPQVQASEIDKIRTLFPKDLEELLTFEVEGQFVILKPRQFLGSENFSRIAAVVRSLDGEYISQGKNSHFKVPLK